ncbi:MAG: CASTOR/POLLUX-related putative ion channel [Flavobacteriaceae bacterium]
MRSNIRYYFENFIARKSNFVYFLMLASAVFAVLMIILEYSLGLIEKDSLLNLWWNRLERLLEIEDSGSTYKERLINMTYWVFSVAFSGTIIAFLAAKVSSFIEDLKKGHSEVIDTNHYVIIGWNSTIFNVFQEIKIANENQSKPTILCFNSMDNIEMNAKINLEYPNQKGLRIITRSGDIYSSQDLARTNMVNAKSVIVLDDTVIPNFNIETTILASKINLNQRNIPLIAQMQKEENIDLLSEIMDHKVYPIHKDKIISNVTAQAMRNKHISAVVLDFLDYDGDEIYFFPSKDLSGKTFKQALLMVSNITLIGIKTSDEKVILNPDKDYIILEDDLLVVISEDDDVDFDLITNTKTNQLLNDLKIAADCTSKKEKLSILVLGWSKLGQLITNRTIPFLSEGSKIHFAYREELVHQSPENLSQHNIEFVSTPLSADQKASIGQILSQHQFDVILILGHDDVLSNEVADTNSLMLNLYVRSILEKQTNANSTRIILQLSDGSKEELIQDNKLNELIVSDTLSSLVITQLADNPKLWYVFEELFSDQGLKISVSSIFDYLEYNQSNSFSVRELILMALEKNQTFIGCILNDELFLNPPKNQTFELNETLELVYLA